MLSVSEFPQFRPQNDLIEIENENENEFEIQKLDKCEFLPANFYPIQTPGYTVHWSEKVLKVVERVGEGAEIVLELETDELNKVILFDTMPKHERRRKRNNKISNGGVFKRLTGWFRDTLKWSKNEIKTETVKIFQVIPLIYDKTLFDLVVILKEKEVFGFIRMRLLMTGSFKSVQRIDGFIPAISGKIVKIINWKSLMIAVKVTGEIRVLDLNEVESEAEWRESIVTGSIGCNDVILCEDKYKETAILLLQNGIKVEIFEIGNVLVKFGTFELENVSNICGYIEDDDLYVIQDKNIYKRSLSLKGTHETTKFTFINKSDNCSITYLVPWRQDFQVSALIVYITKISDKIYKISVVSIDGTDSSVIHESEEFKNDTEFISIFVSSSLEIFLLDLKGNVQIYSGLLLSSDWEWQQQRQRQNQHHIEFSHWFNILDNFPFRSYEYYKERRTRFNEILFIDELLAEYQMSFPPTDWKGLGQACIELKVEIVLYYLLACDTGPEKINSFYYNFGLNDKQVAFIETCFYADHGQISRAIKIFCTRKMDEVQRNLLVPKLVKYLKFDCDNEELVLFSLFCAGRLISIDLLINDEAIMNSMIESILNGRGVSVTLEWIKGLFAWLRPDDRCALIPVASLHQQLLKKILNVVLVHPNNSKFKSLGNDFVESQFDPDTLRSILDHLSGCEGDRAAWLITMICASRGRLHRYLLEYDFEGMVKDEDVLEGIEAIKAILRPLVSDQDQNFKSYSGSTSNYSLDNCSSPLVIPGTPQMNRSSSLKSSFSNHSPSKLVNVYSRIPSSPQPLYSSPISPTFIPKHYPPKKPTMLSRKSHHLEPAAGVAAAAGEEEEIDPFKDDLIKLSGKRAREEILELKPVRLPSSNDDLPVILTKSEKNDLKFESVIKVEMKRKTKRRRT